MEQHIPETDHDAMYSDVGGKLLTRRIGEAENIAETFYTCCTAITQPGKLWQLMGGYWYKCEN